MVIKQAPNGGRKIMLAPKGREMYIWKIINLFGGDYKKMVEWANYMKLKRVNVKVLNGKWKYNYWNAKWHVKDLVKAFHNAGIEVYGWQWVLMDDPKTEGLAAVNAVKELGLDGFVMNIEAPCKNIPTSKAHAYTQEITAIKNVPIGFCSYRFPNYHRGIFYPAYLDVCTYIAPEVYWAPSHNPVAQLVRSIKEYADMGYGHMPVVPVGSAYSEHGYSPTKQEMIDFNQGVIELKLPGISWWRFQQAVDLGFASTIKNMPDNYGGVVIPTPPPPLPETHFRTKANLNIRASASAQSADVGTLAQGSDITIVERDGVWGKIKGWVHTDFLEPL